MPKARTTKQTRRSTARKPARAKATGKPERNAARRKKRKATSDARRTGGKATASRNQRRAVLPGWSDLASHNERAPGRPRAGGFIEQISTVRFALLLLAVAACFTLYIGHVHATQDLLAELQQTRRENLRLHLKLNRLKGDFDRATGPAVVYQRARELGLEEGIAYGPTIRAMESR